MRFLAWDSDAHGFALVDDQGTEHYTSREEFRGIVGAIRKRHGPLRLYCFDLTRNLLNLCSDDLIGFLPLLSPGPSGLSSARIGNARWYGIEHQTSTTLREMAAAMGGAPISTPVERAEVALSWVLRTIPVTLALRLEPGPTSGSVAFRGWRSTCREKWPAPSGDQAFQWRRALYGGRRETYYYGSLQGPLVAEDLRSAYPWACTQPLPLPSSWRDGPDLRAEHGVTEATVISNLRRPILPAHSPTGAVEFPNGVFRGSWTNLELRAALDAGVKLVALHSGGTWRYTGTPLRRFTEKLLDARAGAQDPVVRDHLKRLANALWGKFGEMGLRTRIDTLEAFRRTFPDPNMRSHIHHWILEQRVAVWRHWGGFPRWANQAWAATIAARVRLRLFERLGDESILRCDTDGIVRPGTPRLPEDAGPGDWRTQGVYDRVELRGEQDYSLWQDGKETIKASGLWRDDPAAREAWARLGTAESHRIAGLWAYILQGHKPNDELLVSVQRRTEPPQTVRVAPPEVDWPEPNRAPWEIALGEVPF